MKLKSTIVTFASFCVLWAGISPVTHGSVETFSDDQVQKRWFSDNFVAVPPAVVLATSELDDLREPEFDLLVDTVGALTKAVLSLYANIYAINVDGVLTVRMTVDQLEILKSHIATRASPLYTKDSINAIITDIDYIIKIGTALTGKSDYSLVLQDIIYYYELWSLVQPGAWLLDYPSRVTNSSLVFKKRELNHGISGRTSNKCIDELTGFGPTTSHTCKPSKFCWNYMTLPGTGSYYITHQLFYILIGMKAGCKKAMNKRVAQFKQISLDHLIETFCANIKQEMKEDEELNGVPADPFKGDINMEQIFFCGMVGYKDFASQRWLRRILKYQRLDGCFALSQAQQDSLYRGEKVKRDEKLYADNCLSHATGVAIGALGQYLRYLVEDPALSE